MTSGQKVCRMFLTLALMMLVVSAMWVLGVSITAAPTAEWVVNLVTQKVWGDL